MNTKTAIAATFLILSSTSALANMQQCCFEARNSLNTDDIICGDDLKVARQIGEDFSNLTGVKFGISKQALKLPIRSESKSNATKPINGIQNVGFILTSQTNQRLKAIIPALKKSRSGKSCTAVSFSKLDESYENFRKFKGIAKLEEGGTSVPKNKCLMTIRAGDEILGRSFTRQLRSVYLKRGIYLLPSSQAHLAQVEVSVRNGGLKKLNGQFDVKYSTSRSRGKLIGKTKGKLFFDYFSKGVYSLSLNDKYDVTRVTNNDQLDYAVLQKRVLNGLNVDRCKSVRR